MNESPLLIHVWGVHPEQENALVDRLAGMFDRVTDAPGFVSARILVSDDRTSVAAVVEMRSAEDRERLEALPEVREALHGVNGAYNLLTRLYHEVESYGGRASPS